MNAEFERASRRCFLQQALVLAATSTGMLPSVLAQQRASDGDVIYLTPRDADYGSRRQLFNQRITLRPAVIAVPRNESGVRAAVKKANADKLPVAIKSGGHSFEGFSLNDGGMVIDLALMNMLSLHADGQLTAGPGCRLASVYDYSLAQGRLLPAGSCGGVGLAGLTLGGGYGLFARQFGLTCDHLTRVRLVDGHGNVQDSHAQPDLLWACRGGGNGHFGVVTQFEFRTQSAPALLHNYRFRYRVTTPAQARVIAEWWFTLMEGLPATSYSALVANSNTLTVVVTSTLSAIDDPGLQPLLTVLTNKATRVLPVTSKPPREAVKQFYGQQGPLPFKNVSAGFYRQFTDIAAVTEALFGAVQTQRGLIYQINTFGPFPAADASAFPHRDQRFIGELQAYWQKLEHGPPAIAAINQLQRQLWQSGVRTHYANYPDAELPDWATAYYGVDGYHRLQQLKQRYDPDNRFRHPQSVSLPGAELIGL